MISYFRIFYKQTKIFFFVSIIFIFFLVGYKYIYLNASSQASQTCLAGNSNFSLAFFKTNNQGERYKKGINHVIVFNPKSEALDFKVNLGLSHPLYAKDNQGKFRQEYIPKLFHELISNENAKLNGQLPIAGINADYIDTNNKPQGLNISRGVEYSGDFKNKRSSFGISAAKPNQRQATLQVGRRKDIAFSGLVRYNESTKLCILPW